MLSSHIINQSPTLRSKKQLNSIKLKGENYDYLLNLLKKPVKKDSFDKKISLEETDEQIGLGLINRESHGFLRVNRKHQINLIDLHPLPNRNSLPLDGTDYEAFRRTTIKSNNTDIIDFLEKSLEASYENYFYKQLKSGKLKEVYIKMRGRDFYCFFLTRLPKQGRTGTPRVVQPQWYLFRP